MMSKECVVFFWPPLSQPQDAAFYRNVLKQLDEQGVRPFIISPRISDLEATEAEGEAIRLKHKIELGFSVSHGLPDPIVADLLGYYENKLNIADKVVAERNIGRVLLRMRILFAKLRPSMVVFHNYQEAGHKLARHLVGESRIPFLILERAPIPGYYVAERKSIYGLSGIWDSNLYNEPVSPTAAEKELIQALRDNPLATATEAPLAPSGSVTARQILVALEEPYSSGWAYSGSDGIATADYPLGADYRYLLTRLAEACKNIGANLVVRPHPRCRLLSRLCEDLSIEVGRGSLKEELEVADLVVCQNTKVAFSSAVSGKRVILMAANPLGKAGCFPVLSPMEFKEELEGILSSSMDSPPPDIGKVESFFVWLVREHYFDMQKDGGSRIARIILAEKRAGESGLPFASRWSLAIRWGLFFEVRSLLDKCFKSISGLWRPRMQPNTTRRANRGS